jgi:hypothetical protein
MFFAYIYPEPPGFKEAAIQPGSSRYDSSMGLSLLSHAETRTAAMPGQVILEFFESAYSAAARLAQWDSALNRRP